ncbi:MAG: penicillin-binding protein activator LpoB [Sulfuriferula sp.]|nr:penicillin-binding protein activator LpoB [Sulfuriferula sp.]
MKRLILAAITLLLLAGCAVTEQTKAPQFDKTAKWVLLPMENNTETPQAGLRFEAITETTLRAHGINQLTKYPSNLTQDSLFEPADAKAVATAMAWVQQSGAKYAVTGTVNEWRYKTGVDGEPAVGITIKIIDVASQQVIWDAAGARTGWGREAVSAIAQKLIANLTSPLK